MDVEIVKRAAAIAAYLDETERFISHCRKLGKAGETVQLSVGPSSVTSSHLLASAEHIVIPALERSVASLRRQLVALGVTVDTAGNAGRP
jgi:hypothetical protein